MFDRSLICRRRLLGWLAATPIVPVFAEDVAGDPAQALNVFDIEQAARAALSGQIAEWIADGADDGLTVAENRRAFEDIAIRARRLVDVSRIDTQVRLFGRSLQHPILLAPVGNLDSIVRGGDLAAARAAAGQGSVMTAASLSNESIERIAQSAGGAVWFQLYPLNDFGIMRDLLARAEAAGSTAVMVTVDSPVMGNRESARRMPRGTAERPRIANLERYSPRPMIGNATLDWSFVTWLRKNTGMKVVLKGIVTREDSKRALQEGTDGLVVSNHGGRQEESLRSTIACLPEIVAAVGGKLPIVIDGGFRRGTDIFKALALGADAVAVGRPYLWGLGAYGESGVTRVLEILRAELVRIMQLSGTRDIASITSDFITLEHRR